MKFIFTLLFSVFFACNPAFAVATKSLQGNNWKSADLTKTWTPPSITDTIAGLADIQTFTNKVINGLNNTITNVSLTTGVTGTLPIANGGTGQTGANAAFNALAPSQTSNSGKYLTTNGTDTSWSVVDALPSQTGNNGKFLTTNGTDTSWAAAGVSTQGQSEGSSVSTLTLKAPYNQITTTGTDERMIETGNGNLLLNPSFEHSTFATSWGALGDTTAAVETTEVYDGKKAVKLTLAAQSGDFWFQDVTPTIKMSGSDLEHGIPVKTSVSGVQVCARNAGSHVSTCKAVDTDNVWRYYWVKAAGPSSGSVGVTLYSPSGSTGDVYLDAAYVGPLRKDRDLKSTLTTKGDIYAASGSATPIRVPVTGNDGYVLTEDSASTGGVKFAISASAPSSSYEISNLGLATSVGSSALTIALKQADGSTNPSTGASAVKVGMRSSTLTSGLYNQRSATAATSIVVESGSTLGQTSAVASTIYVYLLDNAGALELAVSGTLFPEGGVITTTDINSPSAGADLSTVMYSDTARTGVPFRLVGRIVNTQSTAGTWASAGTSLHVSNYGSLIPGVTSSSTGLERIERANIANCTGSPCTISSQSGTWLTSVTRGGTGSYDANIATGMFSAAPTCWTNQNAGNNFTIIGATTSAVSITMRSTTAAAATDGGFNLICMGPR